MAKRNVNIVIVVILFALLQHNCKESVTRFEQLLINNIINAIHRINRYPVMVSDFLGG